MFVYGTQYLRGATPERDQWEKDMASMKACGFNTIRAWLVWNAIEKVEGEIDYDYLSGFLNCAKKYDLNVGLLFHMHACPEWAVKKYSSLFYMNEDNLPFEPAGRPNTPSGGWPGLCFDHEETRELEYRFISNVIAETKKYDNVAFYEPMNEPHQWVDYAKHPYDIFCYCPATRKKFQQWLRNKYHSIDALNNAWGYFYNDFDEVRPPRWLTSYADYADFRIFTMDNVAEEVKYRTDIIRSCDTKPVIAHAWGGGSVTCVQLGGMAFDDWKNAEMVDKWGFSAFPWGKDDCCVLGLSSNAARSAAGGKEYWQSELTGGMTGSSFSNRGRVDAKTFDKFNLESIRHGAKGILYWQYRKERIGSEFGGYAMTDYEGGPTLLTEKAIQLGKFLREHGDTLKEGSLKPAKIGIVFSPRSHLACWCASEKNSTKNAVDSFSGYYRMFWEENIPIDVLHEERYPDLSAYQLIILPNAMAIHPKMAEDLKKFIENGGTILSEQAFGIFDETLKLSYHVPGYGFAPVFGAKNDELIPRKNVTIIKDETVYELPCNYIETYKNVTAKVLCTYHDGTPAILSNTYGKGTAILTGVNLGFSYSGRELVSDDFVSTDKANTGVFAKDFVMALCRDLNIAGNPCTATNVKVSVFDGPEAGIVIMINNENAPKEGTFPVDAGYTGIKTVYGTGIAKLDAQTVQFSIGADESVVFRLYRN